MSDPMDNRANIAEEAYFKRVERELIEKMRAKMEAEKRESEYLQCPRCDGKLIEVAFEGVQIDICNKCGGAWLDKGEFRILTRKSEGGWLSRLWGSSDSE